MKNEDQSVTARVSDENTDSRKKDLLRTKNLKIISLEEADGVWVN